MEIKLGPINRPLCENHPDINIVRERNWCFCTSCGNELNEVEQLKIKRTHDEGT